METKQQAACYIRVSTEEQTEYSPEAQRRALEGYARQHGYSIDPAHVYVDAGISGRRAETRPAFMTMIAAAKGKPPPFTAILVHKFDRFARNREDSIVYKSLRRRQCGVQVISITEHLEDDRMGLILEAMLEAMAEYYSINLADEVRKGMVEKARRGELQTAPPFGYRVEGHTLVPVEEEARVVQALYQRFFGRGVHGRLGPVDPAAGGAHPPGQSFRQPAGEVYPDQPGLSGDPSMAPRGTGTGNPVGGGGGPPATGFSGDLPSSSGTAGGLHSLYAPTCPALGGPKALAGRTGHLCRLRWGIGVCAATLPPVWLVCQRKVHLLPTCEGRGLSACGDGPPSGG